MRERGNTPAVAIALPDTALPQATIVETEVRRPVIEIYEGQYKIAIDGEESKFGRKGEMPSTWEVFQYLARNPQGVNTQTVVGFLRRIGKKGHIHQTMEGIKINLGPLGESILTRVGGNNTSTYKLDADIVFIPAPEPSRESSDNSNKSKSRNSARKTTPAPEHRHPIRTEHQEKEKEKQAIRMKEKLGLDVSNFLFSRLAADIFTERGVETSNNAKSILFDFLPEDLNKRQKDEFLANAFIEGQEVDFILQSVLQAIADYTAVQKGNGQWKDRRIAEQLRRITSPRRSEDKKQVSRFIDGPITFPEIIRAITDHFKVPVPQDFVEEVSKLGKRRIALYTHHEVTAGHARHSGRRE